MDDVRVRVGEENVSGLFGGVEVVDLRSGRESNRCLMTSVCSKKVFVAGMEYAVWDLSVEETWVGFYCCA